MKDVSTRPESLGWVAAVFALLLLVCGAILGQAAQCTAMAPAWLAATVLLIFSLVAAGRARFNRRQAREETQFEEYRRTRASAELFDDSDEAVKLSARANRQYVQYFVPVATVIVGLGLLATCLTFWLHWNQAILFPEAKQPFRFAVLAIAICVGCVIAGSYLLGVSREAGCRWLRPSGTWLFLVALLFLLSGLVLLAEHARLSVEHLDPQVARVGVGILVLLGAELVLNFVIEFYRPRSMGEEERPLFESKILALFTEPGGVAKNVAAALDYQFGFSVSEVWFYRFLERTLLPFTAVMVILLWLQTCLVVVGTEENGIRERLGKVTVTNRTPLPPGLYVKLPAPLERIRKFPVERVQMIPVGYVPGAATGPEEQDPAKAEMQGDPTGRVMVWSRSHAKDETNFIVATRPDVTAADLPEGKMRESLPVTVNFLAASIPLYFRVSNLYDYLYRHKDPVKTLEELATKEVVRYLANVDSMTILTAGRAAGGADLQRRIQATANDMQLGIDLVFVGLQGLHPPVEVGAAFDEVVGAMEEKHEEVLMAEQYAIRRTPEAEARGLTMETQAEGYTHNRMQVAEAESERFRRQLLAYEASPRLYVLRSFLDVLETEGSKARKYVVATSKSTQVYVLNLEKKIRTDLLDLDLGKKE